MCGPYSLSSQSSELDSSFASSAPCSATACSAPCSAAACCTPCVVAASSAPWTLGCCSGVKCGGGTKCKEKRNGAGALGSYGGRGRAGVEEEPGKGGREKSRRRTAAATPCRCGSPAGALGRVRAHWVAAGLGLAWLAGERERAVLGFGLALFEEFF